MTESTELQAFKRQKDGYKVTVKISLCICVFLSWDELKNRQNLLANDYEIYMICLLVITVYWRKSLQFVKRSKITLLPCLFMILSAVSIIILRLDITFWQEPRFCVVFSPPLFISRASHWYCTSPQMIPGPQMIPDRKWFPNCTANDTYPV